MQANGPSPQVTQYLKEVRRGKVFDLLASIVGTAFGAVAIGFIISLFCFAMSSIFLSILGDITLQLIADVTLNYANLIPYGLAPWVIFGPPALVFGYTLLNAIATNTHGFHFSTNGFAHSLMNGIGYGAPFAGFLFGMSFGLPLVTTLVLTWGLGTGSGLYLMKDSVIGAFAALKQPLPRMPTPEEIAQQAARREAEKPQDQQVQAAQAAQAAPAVAQPAIQGAAAQENNPIIAQNPALTPGFNQARAVSDQAARLAPTQPVQDPNLDPVRRPSPNN